jgi:hypothetical protein
MTLLHTTLHGATGSFGLDDANAMAHKAWRELRRAREAKNSQDRIDAAINCAITAWHLTDWSWAGITSAGRHQTEISQMLGVTGRLLTRADLVTWAISACPELVLCQGVCNGSKHVQADRSVETAAKAPDRTNPGEAAATTLIIFDNGIPRDALEVLQEAVNFWGRQVTQAGVML